MISNNIKYKLASIDKGFSDLKSVLESAENETLDKLFKEATRLYSTIGRFLDSNKFILPEARVEILGFVRAIDSISAFCEQNDIVFKSSSGRRVHGKRALSKLSSDAFDLFSLLVEHESIGKAGPPNKIEHDHQQNLLDKSESRFNELAASFRKQHSEAIRESQKKLNELLINFNDTLEDSENKISSKLSVIESTVQEYKAEIGVLGNTLKDIEESQKNQINKVNSIYEEAAIEIEEKKNQIGEQLKIASEGVIASSFDNGAISERTIANRLRNWSLFCMGLIVLITFVTFIESTEYGFDWESSILRFALIFTLSIPATYLSRESSKHRLQEHNLHQTALDLKTIDPYIKSISEPERTKLRVSLVESILSKNSENLGQQDSFPINSNELLVELIRKMDLSSNQKTEQSNNTIEK